MLVCVKFARVVRAPWEWEFLKKAAYPLTLSSTRSLCALLLHSWLETLFLGFCDVLGSLLSCSEATIICCILVRAFVFP